MKKRSILTVNIRKKVRYRFSIELFYFILLLFFFIKKCRFFTIMVLYFFPFCDHIRRNDTCSRFMTTIKKKLIRWERNLLPILLSFLRLPSSPLIFLFHIVFRRLPSRLHFIRDNIRKTFKAMRSYSRYIRYLKTKTFNCLRILIEISFSCPLWGFIVLSILLSDN